VSTADRGEKTPPRPTKKKGERGLRTKKISPPERKKGKQSAPLRSPGGKKSDLVLLQKARKRRDLIRPNGSFRGKRRGRRKDLSLPAEEKKMQDAITYTVRGKDRSKTKRRRRDDFRLRDGEGARLRRHRREKGRGEAQVSRTLSFVKEGEKKRRNASPPSEKVSFACLGA